MPSVRDDNNGHDCHEEEKRHKRDKRKGTRSSLSQWRDFIMQTEQLSCCCLTDAGGRRGVIIATQVMDEIKSQESEREWREEAISI